MTPQNFGFQTFFLNTIITLILMIQKLFPNFFQIFTVNRYGLRYFCASEALQKTEGMILKKIRLFHQ
jgi:hypothetical protein